jgi:hypothetical protein
MKTTLRFDPTGAVECLYTEAIDLRQLGRLHIVRATGIEFNPDEECWEVRHAESGQILHSDPSREDCLAWEQANLQPGGPVPLDTTRLKTVMKLAIIASLVVAACLVPSCGPGEKELRAELKTIDAEILSLQIAARQYQSQMSQADFDAFIGSFAAGFGAVTGDGELAIDGSGTALDAAQQARAAGYSLDQISQRFDALSARQREILKDLD